MKSLKMKLLLVFSIIMALILMAIGVITAVSVNNIVIPLNNSLTQQVVDARSAEIGKYLDGIKNDITAWSERNMIRSGDKEAIRADLEARQEKLRTDYLMVFYSDLNGDYFTSLGADGNIKDRAYFQKIINGESFALSDPVVSKSTGDVIFVAAHAVTDDNGKLTGVIAASILLDAFNDVVQSIKIGEKGYAWIMDSTGLIFAHPDDNVKMTLNTLESAEKGFIGLDSVAKGMISGESGIGQYMKDKELVSVIYAPVPSSPGWSMAYTMYYNELMAPVDNLTLMIVVIVIIGIIISAAAVFVISGKIVKPVKATAECAKAMSGGDLDAPLIIKTKDEIGQLARILDSEVRGAFKDIEKAQTITKKQAQYQAEEVEKLVVNLRRLSRGELLCDISVREPDEDTAEINKVFTEIANNLHMAVASINGYIKEISFALGQVAAGNLNVAITSEYLGDFIELKESINGIIESLNSVMIDIGTSAEQVASGTSQVSGGSQAISQGATEQASSIEELSASITQIAEQTRQNALSAGKANEMSNTAKDDAVAGNEKMKALQQAMIEINESSSSISKIIKVIDDIAFQTNILALNAAVEAARAGAHGKGFAVVAEEVRTLAARSASAAKETTEMIETSIKKAEVGTEIASDTAQALSRIVDGVQSAVVLVADIAAASNQQATAIHEVNKGIEQMSQVVQTNSATAQEAAAAAEELSSQAEMLKNMVAQFQVTTENHTIGTLQKLTGAGESIKIEPLKKSC